MGVVCIYVIYLAVRKYSLSSELYLRSRLKISRIKVFLLIIPNYDPG